MYIFLIIFVSIAILATILSSLGVFRKMDMQHESYPAVIIGIAFIVFMWIATLIRFYREDVIIDINESIRQSGYQEGYNKGLHDNLDSIIINHQSLTTK